MLGAAPVEAAPVAPVAPTEKPAEGVKPAEVAPAAEVELKLPEGFKADDALLGQFKATAKELGLKSEQAQKVFDLYAGAQKAQAEATQKALEAESKQWVDAVKADKDIGGANLQASLVAANKAVHQFGGPELHQLLDATGLGNHPLVVKTFARIGKAIAEDSSAGTRGANGGNSEEARHRALYPNSPELFERK